MKKAPSTHSEKSKTNQANKANNEAGLGSGTRNSLSLGIKNIFSKPESLTTDKATVRGLGPSMTMLQSFSGQMVISGDLEPKSLPASRTTPSTSSAVAAGSTHNGDSTVSVTTGDSAVRTTVKAFSPTSTVSAMATDPASSLATGGLSTYAGSTLGSSAMGPYLVVSSTNPTIASSTSFTSSGTLTASTSRTSTAGSTFNASTTSTIIHNQVAFSENVDRAVKVRMIATCQPFETTSQLVHFARLLHYLDQSAASASSPESALSPSSQSFIDEFEPCEEDQVWIGRVKDDILEQARIRRLVIELVKEFLALPFKDPESVREIVLMAPVLDKSTYQALLRCLLQEFDKQGIMNEETLQGVIQVVEDAPPEVLEVDNLIMILERIRNRLESTASQSPVLILHLTQAISRILSVMADMKVKDLDRVKTHSPVRTALAALKGDDNPYLRYQAIYALQALRFVPDDETPVECFARHAFKIGGSLVKLSSVMQMNFDGFADGLVEAKQSIMDIYGIAKDGLDELISLKEDGKMLIDDVLGSTTLNSWFVCLRGAEELARNGQLVKLSECINKFSMNSNQNFQWGVCQILGEIAADSSFDLTTRSCSIDYFGWIYSTTTHNSVKSWILTLLGYLSELKTQDPSCASADEAIKSQAATVAQSLYKDEDKSSIFTNIFKKDSSKPFEFPYLLRRCLPFPLACSLLQKANKIPDVEPKLHTVRTRLKDNGPAVYVPLMCKVNFQASSTDNLKFLEETVTDFLASKKEVLLILGDSGAGKSTFNRYLEHKLWNEYKPGGSIPLFIDLKAMGRLDDVDMIQKTLDLLNFEDFEIRELKRSRQMILICDGYDECRQWTNLHKRMKSELKWESLKVVITCRTQYLAVMDDRSSFKPRQEPGWTLKPSDLYVESVIVPFQKDQIQNYIEQFRGTQEAASAFGDRDIWTSEYFLNQLTSLMDLVKNPFMLHLALRILPEMAKDGRDLSTVHLSRFELYDEFTKRHFENEQNRLIDGWSRLDAEESRAFKLIKNTFPLHCMGYSKRLACTVFMENDGVNAVEYSMSGEEQGWKDNFFGLDVDPKVTILRQSSQLNSYTIAGSSELSSSDATRTMYQFPHRSILEFLYACQLCDHWDSSAFFKYFETTRYNNLSSCLSCMTGSSLLVDHSLNQRSVVSEPSILDFLVDQVRRNPEFKEQLINIINLSKTNDEVSQAAANAITVLVRAGVRFNNQDLRGIRIRGADLSGGQFDGAQMQGSDLTDSTLCKVWLRAADLSGAKMGNVKFGELPYIQVSAKNRVKSCAYSPDKKMFATVVAKGKMELYDTSNWTKLHTCQGYPRKILSVQFSPDGQKIILVDVTGMVEQWDTKTGFPYSIFENQLGDVKSVAFSPDGDVIVTGGKDGILRLWDAQTGAPRSILEGHTAPITNVVYSPNGGQIASSSEDGTARLWNAYTGKVASVLTGHLKEVTSVIYSPNSQQIASRSDDETIRLWDTQTGTPGPILRCQSRCKVAYSPDGQQIAAGDEDNSVRLWNSQTGAPGPILNGHSKDIKSIVFSSSGQQIASGSDDGTVRLWDVQSGALDAILEGHTKGVVAVEYLLDGRRVASYSNDTTVRLWDVQMSTTRIDFKCHTDMVTSVVFSHHGQQVASASRDQTVRLWDAKTGDPGPVLQGHTGGIQSVVYSPNGQEIASGSQDGTVRLWDAGSGALGKLLEECTGGVVSVVYSPNGKHIVASTHDRTVRLWDLKTGAICHDFYASDGRYEIAPFSLSDEIISLCSGERTVQIRDIQAGTAGPVFKIRGKYFKHMVLSPDGKQIATASLIDTVQLWNATTGAPSTTLELRACFKYAMAYSPCGMEIAVGCSDRTVQLCSTQTGKLNRSLDGHSGYVNCIRYSSNGQYIVSGSDDQTIRLWNVNSGQCLARIAFCRYVSSIAWHDSINCSYFAVGCGDNSVSVWQAGEEDSSFKVRLLWTTSQNRLHMAQARIRQVQDLSDMNRQLLKQRGAEMSDDEMKVMKRVESSLARAMET